MKNRRKSRELALQALYARDMWAECDVDRLIDYMADEKEHDAAIREYAQTLVHHTLEAIAGIDIMLQKHAANWDLKRMAAIDRNIMRMSIAELTFCKDVPYKVVIDEAVELAKQYGTDESGRFVNGVLDSSYKELSKVAKSETAPHANNHQQ
jgi:transcription antitermination protein NusB